MYLMSLLTGFAGGLDGLNCAKAQEIAHARSNALSTIVLAMATGAA